MEFYATINFHQCHDHRIVTCLYRSDNLLTNSPSVFWPPSCRKVEPQNGEREVVSTCVGSFSISLLHDNKEVFQGVKEVDRRRVSNVSPSKATIMPVDVSTTFPKRG